MANRVTYYTEANTVFDNGNGNELWTQFKYWRKDIRLQSYWYEHRQDLETGPDSRNPKHVDHWIDEADSNNMKGVWTDNFPYSGDGGGGGAWGCHQYTGGELDGLNNLWKFPSTPISLDLPVIISKDSGTADGRILARATGGTTWDYEYELTLEGGFIEINNTGEFNDLVAGAHTLTVRSLNPDPNDPVSQVVLDYPVTVELSPQYGVMYTCTFQNDFGRDVTVEILRENYEGAPREMCMGGTPVVINTDVIGDDFLSGVMPMQITVELAKQSDDEFNEFFITDNDAWLIRVVDTGFLDVTGRMIIEEIEIEHQDNPVTITVTAQAGLTDIVDVTIEDWSGPIKLIDVINYIQQEYNLIQYPIREFVGYSESTDPDEYQRDTFSRYKVSAAMFNGMEPKEAINEILKVFGCSFTHSYDNHIQIQNAAMITMLGPEGDVLDGGWYTRSGKRLGTYPMNPNPIFIKCDRTEDGFYVGGNQSYGALPKVNKALVKDNFRETDVYVPSTHQWDWDTIAASQYDGSLGSGDIIGESVRFNGVNTVSEGLYSMTELYRYTVGAYRLYHPNLRINISYQYKFGPEDISPDTTQVKDIYSYLVIMYGKNGCFNNEGTTDYNIGHLFTQAPKEVGDWDEFETENEMILDHGGPRIVPPSGGLIRLYFYSMWSSWDDDIGVNPQWQEVKDIKIEILLPLDNEENEETEEMDLQNDGINLGDYDMFISDAPYLKIGYGVQIGGVCVKAEDLTLTRHWKVFYGYTEPTKSLKGQMLYLIEYLRSKNVKRLEGSLSCEFPKIGEALYDPSLDGIFFMIQRLTYDVKNNILGFSALEIIASTGDRLIESDPIRETEDGNLRKLQ